MHHFDLLSLQAVHDMKSTRQMVQQKQYMEMLHDHARKVPKLKSNIQPQMQLKSKIQHSSPTGIAHGFPSIPGYFSHLHPDQIAVVANFDQGVVPKRQPEALHALGPK